MDHHQEKQQRLQRQQEQEQEQDIVMARVRERQWIYVGPIVAAPLAHICVTLYRSAKTPQAKRWLFSVGIVGSTVATLGTRLYLLQHAGYPGGPNTDMAKRERLVTLEEKRSMEHPSWTTMVKETFKGFG